MGNYFVFGGYSAFRFREFGFISDLVNNSVKYVSPSWGGFRLRGLYAMGEGTTGDTGELALNYSSNGLSAGASYREAKNLAGDADKLTSVGASYAIGNFRPHAGWSESDSRASNLPKARAYDVGLTWTPNTPWALDFDYVAKDQLGTGNDAHFWRVQAQYFLSKRTSLMGNLVWLKNDGTSSERFYGVGAAWRRPDGGEPRIAAQLLRLMRGGGSGLRLRPRLNAAVGRQIAVDGRPL